MKVIDFNKYPLPPRTRHHTSPNFYLPLKELKIVPKFYPPLYDNINWNDIFRNGNPPNILDIGCGRGLFLLRLAEDIFPNKNILGLEVRDWCCIWLDNYTKSENIDNCRVLRYCVANGLRFLKENSINEVYYLFPDPWIKTKHIRRRAFNQKFLSEINRILIPGGSLYLATDLIEVHNYHLKELEAFNQLEWKVIENDIEWNRPPTNKEEFCLRNNIKTYKIIVKK